MGHSQATEAYHRPRVILNAAMTLDGKIATTSGDSRISSNADLRRVHKLRSEVDAIIVGIGTLISDNPRLTVRRVNGTNPFRVVVDSLARTPPTSRIFASKDGKTIVAVSRKAPNMRVKRLEERGAKIVRCGSPRVDLRALLARLHSMGVERVLLEGGGKLNWSMLANHLVDEIRITVAPLIVGGEKATTLAEGVGVSKMSEAIKLSLRDVERRRNELVLNYGVAE